MLRNGKYIGYATDKPYYEVIVFFVLTVQFAILRPSVQNMDDMMATIYFLNYQDFGFSSRLFIGSVFKIFYEYISGIALHNAISIIIICYNLVVSFLLGRVLRRSHKDEMTAEKIFVVLFLACPFSVSFMYDKWNFGYSDIYIITVTIFMILIANKKYFMWLLPFFCVIAIAIHPAWVLLYMPAIAVIWIYRCFRGPLKKKNRIIGAISIVVLFVAFFYFQFLTPDLEFSGPREVATFLSKRTDIKLSTNYIMAHYFLEDPISFYSDTLKIVKFFALRYSVSTLVVTAPLVAIFIALWPKAYKFAKDKFEKFIIFLCLMAPVAIIPLLSQMDWDRWIAAVFLVQFSLVFYFLYDGFECVKESAERIRHFFDKHMLLFVLSIIFLSAMLFSVSRPLYYYLQQDMAEFFYEMFDRHFPSVS